MTDDGAHGPCQIAATFCEIFANSDAQRQLDSAWGLDTGHSRAALSAGTMQEPNTAPIYRRARNLRDTKRLHQSRNVTSPAATAANTTTNKTQDEQQTPQDSDDEGGTSPQEPVSHQNIHLSHKSSKELRRLMHDLEQLVATSAKRKMPSEF